ncbi:MAG: glycosyltransferase family 4 protein [bacterium]|nr:glycosyltransferase family 4 protein [bacterium]
MKVLMFGWEFPPFNSGGLGVACEGLAKALAFLGVKVVFVLPKKLNCSHPNFKIIFADDAFDNLKIRVVDSLITPYATSQSYREISDKIVFNNFYETDLFKEVLRYGQLAKKIAKTEVFDVIHAHDWLSFPAGIMAKNISGKPLVVQIHATEFDRCPSSPNPFVYSIEKIGMEVADAVIAVSNYTKNKIIENYGIAPDKIRVVHNAIDPDYFNQNIENPNQLFGLKKAGKKIVLFVGRITLQKGPDYFLRAAQKVLQFDKNVIFIMAGSGDMERQMIEMASGLGIADKFLFAGFLTGEDLKKAYLAADLFVLPSVSEPFGLAALESLALKTPILVSKQSGIAEVIQNALKVDFWDTDEIANKILACLNYQGLGATLQEESLKEMDKLSWEKSAQKCLEIYNSL